MADSKTGPKHTCCEPMKVGNPKAAEAKKLEVPKLVRKDKAMPVKGKGR